MPIPGYKLYSAKYGDDRIGRGAAIYVNSDIHVTVLESHSTRVLIKHLQTKLMIIGCIYHPTSDYDRVNLKHVGDTLNRLTIQHIDHPAF